MVERCQDYLSELRDKIANEKKKVLQKQVSKEVSKDIVRLRQELEKA